MLGQSGILTLLGMGIVFSFLVIMVICVSAMGKILQALGANKDAPAPEVQASSPARPAAITAAIAAAISEYQKDHS